MKITLITLVGIIFLSMITAQVPIKGGHEDWCVVDPVSFDDPECWENVNPLCVALGEPSNVALTDDAYSGTYALRLQTGIDTIGMPQSAIAVFKNALYARPEKLTGYYKADIKADDYSTITVSFLSERGLVGWGSLEFDRSNISYAAFEIPMHYISPTIQPDSFLMFIYSSGDRPVSGTVIVLDELAFESFSDVTIPLTEKFISRITPNPATDEILVQVPGDNGMLFLKIFDGSGQTMEYETFENQIRINVSEYTAGLYLYEIRMANHAIYDKGRFTVGKHGM